ncbi:glycoside hydrolase family 43 protein [Haliscomenobacter hydrossis]|uniref:Beta-galactosidase I n=1 Tax=Haliscomenobacter hydrossis (strain ATCC 27775 / DSM 1100 / LMG 10767 / O) TaxID=760192 RepID=F4KZG1_HALH1|nr:glycoside hydrolase family 43 protein [Haliscomenobacter hydrossis]AEE49431.1 beta-galactosidase I [Haliscomenobacter hydrossis DSM 1100]
MIQRISLLLLLGLCGSLHAQSGKMTYLFSYFKGNGEDGLHLAYSQDGLKWSSLNADKSYLQPVVGTSKLMRDPCIVQAPDGIFHMVWTSGWTERGIGYASSRDLISWSEQQYLPVMDHEPTARNCWAPELFYDKASKQYLIYWSTTIPGRFPKGASEGDSGYNHRMYYTTTTDFKNFSPTRLLYDHDFNVIDGTIQKVKGEYVLFLKDETRNPARKNLRIARSKQLTEGYSAASEPITGKYWAEGPTVLKIKKHWMVYFDKYTEKKYGAVRSSDLKTWEDISEQVSFPAGLRHGTVFTVKTKWFEEVFKVK